MSNFPIRYKLTWLPRLLRPAVGDGAGFKRHSRRFIEARQTVRLVFFGDFSAVSAQNQPVLEANLRELLGSADLVIGICESPVVERPRFALGTRLGSRHAMSKMFVRDFLEAANMRPSKLLLSVANNHALDQGVEGFEETLGALDELGVRTVGAVRDRTLVLNVGPLLIAFQAFTLWRNTSQGDFEGRVVMDHDLLTNGSALISASATSSGAPATDADLICVLPHWGWEFRHGPQPEVQALARKLVGHGAGLIVGGHQHIVQPVEHIGEALVAYGLGDFLGTVWRWVPQPLRTAAVLVVDVSTDEETKGQIAGYDYVPVERERVDGRERLTIRP